MQRLRVNFQFKIISFAFALGVTSTNGWASKLKHFEFKSCQNVVCFRATGHQAFVSVNHRTVVSYDANLVISRENSKKSEEKYSCALFSFDLVSQFLHCEVSGGKSLHLSIDKKGRIQKIFE